MRFITPAPAHTLDTSSLHAAERALRWAEIAGAGPYTLEAMRRAVALAREAMQPQGDPMDAVLRRFADEVVE